MDPDLWFRVLFFIFSEDQSGEVNPAHPSSLSPVRAELSAAADGRKGGLH